MSVRLRVVHTTGFSYSGNVGSSYNEARLTPRSDARQTVMVTHIDISPQTRRYQYTDYWGTSVTAFDIHRPHEQLEVIGTSVVETDVQVRHDDDVAATWEQLRDDDFLDEYDEWLAPTAYVPYAKPLRKFARDAAGDLGPADAVLAVVTAVCQEMTYEAGSTDVHWSAADAWRHRKGVCQDFAHITLSMIRSLGIPARYVSGYVHPHALAEIGESVPGESHAWIEVWTGGWWGIDPTNDKLIDENHVTVGTGRDYGDLTPIKGIYTGGAVSEMGVTVRITRLA